MKLYNKHVRHFHAKKYIFNCNFKMTDIPGKTDDVTF